MNLLIVDDDSICSFINMRVAQTSGIFRSVDAVHNGQDALRYFDKVNKGQAVCPDVILLDLNMPIIGGFDFIKAFRNLSLPKSDIAIIVLTSSENPGDIKRAEALGVDQYLMKPLTVNDLQSAIYSLRNIDTRAGALLRSRT